MIRWVLVLVLFVAGCVPLEAVEQAKTEHAIAVGHAADEGLPLEARMIGADEARAWDAQHLSLTGDRVPGAAAFDALLSEGALAPVSSGAHCPVDTASCGCPELNGTCELPPPARSR